MMENRAASWPDWLPIRADLTGLSPYGAPQINDVISLNTNENPFPLPDGLVTSMLQQLPEVLTNLNRYPDRDATQLRSALAGYINAQSQSNFRIGNIWAANGSNEILQTLMLAFGARGVLGFVPSYSMHPLIAKVVGSKWIEGIRGADFSLNVADALVKIAEFKPGLTFITTPNNPTGTSLTIAEIEELASATHGVKGLLIVDEAYAEFSDELSAVTLVAKFPNVVVVRTMSKAFAFAGARVGYLVGAKEISEAMLVTRLPYHLSSMTQAIARIAIGHATELLGEVAILKAERSRISSALTEMGFDVLPSAANFLAFSGFTAHGGDASANWQALLSDGVLIRDIGIPGYLRVTVGTPDENSKFLAAVAKLKP